MKIQLNEGDVIFSDCIGSQLCYHLGIVYKKGDKVHVFHNAPTNLNQYGGTIISEPFNQYKKMREIIKVVNTDAKNNDILIAAHKYRHEVWDSIFFNCEDFVTEIVHGQRESNIRDAYQMAALGIAIILLI